MFLCGLSNLGVKSYSRCTFLAMSLMLNISNASQCFRRATEIYTNELPFTDLVREERDSVEPGHIRLATPRPLPRDALRAC